MKNSVRMPSEWVAFRLGHLGDVVLTTGVLAVLGETRGWSFSIITKKAWAEIFTGHPHVSECIALAEEDLNTASFLAFSRRLADANRAKGLLDLHGSLRSRLLSLAWRGPVLRYPKMGLQRRVFLASGKRLYGERLRASTVAQRYFMAVDSPPPASTLLPRIWLGDAEIQEARTRLEALSGPASAPVALHPYATHALKAWPEEHWRALAALIDARGIPWIGIGRGAPLFPGDPRDLTNATSLRQSCALLSLCRALISGDSGPMHLGTAVGTPVIALFGPTTREWGFFPAGPKDIALESTLPCRPCSLHGKTPCPQAGECLAALAPERVMQAIEQSGAKV